MPSTSPSSLAAVYQALRSILNNKRRGREEERKRKRRREEERRNEGYLRQNRFTDGPASALGKIKMARLSFYGQTVLCNDSYISHPFTFTPSFSLFVTCTSLEEIKRLAQELGLGGGGKEMMPIDNYGFSRQFAWVNDKFGVSWQLNLP